MRASGDTDDAPEPAPRAVRLLRVLELLLTVLVLAVSLWRGVAELLV